jgi:cyclic pyranopterin monophosphate synthase
VTGFGPAILAWEANALPLGDTRILSTADNDRILTCFNRVCKGFLSKTLSKRIYFLNFFLTPNPKITACILRIIITSMSAEKLSHVDEAGKAHMVNVGEKPETDRIAVARGEVHLSIETMQLIRAGLMKKGDVLTVAQIAGIQAAKRTAELIPLCHTIPLTHVEVDISLDDSIPGVVIEARVRTFGRTGVEMEALTAVSVAALTIYDMVKAVEKTGRITNICLVEKHGGQSGDFYNKQV